MANGLKKYFRFLANPFLISVVPALIIAWLIPVNHSRYLLETLSAEYMDDRTFYFYEDLTGDGYSEKIKLEEGPNANSILVYDHTRAAYNQWNLHGGFGFVHTDCLYISGDYDGDEQKEIYVFTLSNDSIFLHALFDLNEHSLAIKNRFLTGVGPWDHGPDPHIIPAEMQDLDGDGNKELIFGINTGFSLYPRNVYAYYIDQDSLVSSPESYAQIRQIIQADLSCDGNRELLLETYSSANIGPEDALYHDHSSWLMVLDQNLQFLFPPVEIEGRFTTVKPVEIPDAESTRLAALVATGSEEETFLRYYTPEGEYTGNLLLPGDPSNVFYYQNPGSKPFFVFSYHFEGFRAYDTLLNPLGTYLRPGNYAASRVFELALDDEKEKIITATVRETNTFHVIRPDLRHPVTAEIFWPEGLNPLVSIIHRGEKRPHISLQAGRNHYIFDYRLNPKYTLNFGFYPAIYLAVLAFALLISRLQKNKLRRELETEQKITELQLSLVKNQLDPHFSLNALNAVMHAAKNQQYEAVETGLSHFSNIYRSMLLSGGTSRRSLEEELAFTESYLELEKLRFKGRIDYRITVAPDVDTSILLPKMLVQIHAENAVKHGLSPLKTGGMLRIGAEASGDKLMITIEDNGVGRASARETDARHPPAYADSEQSTGMGLALMQELYGLYKKYYNQHIASQITDLRDENGQPAGTLIRIEISAS
ncbi:MAG: histidine kinase [Bacteroidales bacterium]